MNRCATLQERPGGILLALRGEIDLAVRTELRHALDTAVTRADGMCDMCGDIEVCLRAVTFLDCSAIGAVVAARNAARRAGHVLFVSHPTGIVRHILELLDDLEHLTIGAREPVGRVPAHDPAVALRSRSE